MPNRIIRDAILTSEAVCSLAWPEEVFYRRLMSIVDDYGRHEASHQLLRSRCYPLQTDLVRVADITRWMAACQKAGVILVYEVAGKQYLQLQKFGQQQRSASKCPGPPESASNCQQPLANAHLGVSVFVSGNSVPNGTDGVPPASGEREKTKSPEDMAKAELWKAAVSVLEAGGCPAAQCRTFMGKLVKDYSLPVVQQAVAQAVAAQPADAREYLKATCQRLKGERADPVTVPFVKSPEQERQERERAEHERKLNDPEERARIAEIRARVKSGLKVVA